MFKNYLTYQFAQNFDRSCRGLELASSAKNELMRCSRALLDHLTRSLHTQDAKERSKSLFVALTYLRDCRAVLEEAKISDFALLGVYEVLNGRLEQLLLDAASQAEGGQLRMFG